MVVAGNFARIVVDITVIVDIAAIRIGEVIVVTAAVVSEEKPMTLFLNPSFSMTILKHS